MRYELSVGNIEVKLEVGSLTDYVFHCYPLVREIHDVHHQDGINENFVSVINKLQDGHTVKFVIEVDENEI